MPRWKRVALALGVIASGICAALPFRQSERPAERPPAPDRAAQHSDRLTLQVAAPPTTFSTEGAPQSEAAASANVPNVPVRLSLDSLQRPPVLPTEFESLPAAVDASVSNENGDVSALDGLSAHVETRTHTIVDGDSLEALAERYLDDARRWRELLDTNRDVLPSADLLPIGTKIIIPLRRSAETGSSGLP